MSDSKGTVNQMAAQIEQKLTENAAAKEETAKEEQKKRAKKRKADKAADKAAEKAKAVKARLKKAGTVVKAINALKKPVDRMPQEKMSVLKSAFDNAATSLQSTVKKEGDPQKILVDKFKTFSKEIESLITDKKTLEGTVLELEKQLKSEKPAQPSTVSKLHGEIVKTIDTLLKNELLKKRAERVLYKGIDDRSIDDRNIDDSKGGWQRAAQMVRDLEAVRGNKNALPSENLAVLSEEKLDAIQKSFALISRDVQKCTEQYSSMLGDKFQACADTLQMIKYKTDILRKSIDAIEATPLGHKKNTLYTTMLSALRNLHDTVKAESARTSNNTRAEGWLSEGADIDNLSVNLSEIYDMVKRHSFDEFSVRFSIISDKILTGLRHDTGILQDYLHRLSSKGAESGDFTRFKHAISKMKS